MTLRISLALAAALLTGLVLVTWRGFPPTLATIAAVAVGALVYATVQTAGRLRTLWHGHRRDGRGR